MSEFAVGDKVVANPECPDLWAGFLVADKEYTVRKVRNDNHLVITEPRYANGDEVEYGLRFRCFAKVVEVPKAPEPSTKESNPKEAMGAAKLALHLVPDAAIAHLSTAFFEGASKYGAYNWRVAGVRASTYMSAARRHLAKWFNGDNVDPNTRVHHLANAMACCAILLDAEVQGKLNDDRPPAQNLEKLMEALAEVQAHLAKINGHLSPLHNTQQNSGGAR